MRTLLMLVALVLSTSGAEAAWRVSKVSLYLVVKYTAKGTWATMKAVGSGAAAVARHI